MGGLPVWRADQQDLAGPPAVELVVEALAQIPAAQQGGAANRGRARAMDHDVGRRTNAMRGPLEGRDQQPPRAPQLNGVFVTPEGEAVAVGLAGAVWRWSKGAWKADEKAPRLRVDLHAAYQDETGGVFASLGCQVQRRGAFLQ